MHVVLSMYTQVTVSSEYTLHCTVFLYYIAPVILSFGHHFRDLLIPTFIVVTILILISVLLFVFNQILLCLASFDFYCESNAVHRVSVFAASVAVQAIKRILWMDLFLAILLNGFLLQ